LYFVFSHYRGLTPAFGEGLQLSRVRCFLVF